MTSPELIKRWHGGVRTTVASAEVDLRVGGTMKVVMSFESQAIRDAVLATGRRRRREL
jgi:uncharacterized protein YndB with AHSA1/START domain